MDEILVMPQNLPFPGSIVYLFSIVTSNSKAKWYVNNWLNLLLSDLNGIFYKKITILMIHLYENLIEQNSWASTNGIPHKCLIKHTHMI